jgi:hypothetical protein
MTSVFVAMSDARMAELIRSARTRIAVALPSIRESAADALSEAVKRLGQDRVGVVLDCDEEVFRLGYGSLNALKRLRESGCVIRQSSGLRIGVLVCDYQAWAFSPTALYVQQEVHSDETPNAITLKAADVERIVASILPRPLIPQQSPGVTEAKPITVPPEIQQEIAEAEVEIGHGKLVDSAIERTTKSLELAPPMAFDVARQVRVFEPYIQYVEISLRGCAIQRHRLEVPKSIQGIAGGSELASRLRTTFELIEKNSKVSSGPLEQELKKIRDNFTRALGKPWGRVVLRAQRDKFDARIDEFRLKLNEHKSSVKKELGETLDGSQQQLLDYFLPLVVANPPDELSGQVSTSSVSDAQARDWLKGELESVFPTPASLVSDMTLDVQFRDVTYETLNEVGFAEKLSEVYPHVDWEKPFSEFDAAKAKGDNNERNAPASEHAE